MIIDADTLTDAFKDLKHFITLEKITNFILKQQEKSLIKNWKKEEKNF
jgi:hypothetical protein